MENSSDDPGYRGACHRAALCADPLAHPSRELTSPLPLAGEVAALEERGGGGNSLHANSANRGDTPTPTLPRKRERELRVASSSNSSYGELLQRNRQPAQIHIGHQSDLLAGQFQHRALLVGQHDRARAAADRKPRAGRAIDAGDIAGTVDVSAYRRFIGSQQAPTRIAKTPAASE